MTENAFPEYCVKQVLSEYSLERGDEHIINMFQNELLPRILMELLKGCVSSAIVKKRKNINESDIENALMLSHFKATANVSKNRIIDSKYFADLVYVCMDCHKSTLQKNNIIVNDMPKFSTASLSTLQRVCESCIRTFVQKMRPYYQNFVNKTSFEIIMSSILGFISNDGYIAYKQCN